MTAEAVLDEVELRLRMLPGVLGVGFEPSLDGGVGVCVALVDGAAPAGLHEEAAVIVAAIPAMDLRVTSVGESAGTAGLPGPADRLRDRILRIAGVRRCAIDVGPEHDVERIRVQVDTIAAVAYAGDLVEDELGVAFARRDLHFELRPHLGDAGTRRPSR